ncbi:unnamed protein product [marine sediment metagenome]|uniref:Uncharacterized protein n=1 Tax=marine sediment metagenome TaxID=412755 RepID=X1C8V5_9ZZZZ
MGCIYRYADMSRGFGKMFCSHKSNDIAGNPCVEQCPGVQSIEHAAFIDIIKKERGETS